MKYLISLSLYLLSFNALASSTVLIITVLSPGGGAISTSTTLMTSSSTCAAAVTAYNTAVSSMKVIKSAICVTQ
ncbi:hypothetical protein UFOVP1_9 [uncultured Caudovirales phage]|uniref:Uncharacterized protein n=1 Tax=uncultured Caudovirales phage TaxID=2100421 RepID=A0A6J5KKX9_9CAUD|nr:hypothetical protein UFOVP1_9 [uncultured Caudovirales phage]